MSIMVCWFSGTGKASLRNDHDEWWCGDSDGWVHEKSTHWQVRNCGPVALCKNQLFDSFTEARNFAHERGWIKKSWRSV